MESKKCDSCEEVWNDNFWCHLDPDTCRNCCPCAFGLSVYKDGKCQPVEHPRGIVPQDIDTKDMPF